MRHLSIVLAIVIIALAGCSAPAATPGGSGNDSTPHATDLASRKIRAVATTGMIGDAVQSVGGDRVEVTTLMGPGVDPHLYKASASDVKLLDDADIIFYNGLELEGRLTDVLVKMSRSRPTVAITEDIPLGQLREPTEFEGKYDPHVWFDVTLWKHAVGTIRDQLAALDPGSGDVYQSNAAAYLAELDALDQFIREESQKIPEQSRVLVTAHDAFGYFGRQYGVEVRGLQGTSTATEAGAGDVQALVDFIVERKIKAIFVETSVPEAAIKAVQEAARSRGHEVKVGGALFGDAMGAAGTPEGTYIGMVRHNVRTIVDALR